MNHLATPRSQVQPERLPSTENAAKYHSYRVHLQVIQWKTLMDSDISQLTWGWRFENDAFVPISSTKQPAPSELLKVIHCNCKCSSKNPHSTNIAHIRKTCYHVWQLVETVVEVIARIPHKPMQALTNHCRMKRIWTKIFLIRLSNLE